MSIKTWKEEFYPVPAGKVKSRLDAIKHSLRKWEGLTVFNLDKHEILIEDDLKGIRDDSGGGLPIDGSTCALCCLYYERSNCLGCPIYEVTGKTCDGHLMSEYGENYPYIKWINNGDPKPMIRVLKKCLKAKEMKDE